MEKLVYALWSDTQPAADAGDQVSLALLGAVQQELRSAGAARLTVSLADIPPPADDPYTAMKTGAPCALVSFWLNAAAFHRPFDAIIARAVPRFAAYAVAESVILPHLQNLGEGVRAPGATQIALFGGLPQISRQQMLQHWMHHHSNVAVETQSTYYYCQNIVTRALTDDAPAYDGIVEETFPLAALDDRMVYFDAVGDVAKYEANVAAMNDSCGRFIDFSNIKLMMAGQYRFGRWADFSYGWHQHGRV